MYHIFKKNLNWKHLEEKLSNLKLFIHIKERHIHSKYDRKLVIITAHKVRYFIHCL